MRGRHGVLPVVPVFGPGCHRIRENADDVIAARRRPRAYGTGRTKAARTRRSLCEPRNFVSVVLEIVPQPIEECVGLARDAARDLVGACESTSETSAGSGLGCAISGPK